VPWMQERKGSCETQFGFMFSFGLGYCIVSGFDSDSSISNTLNLDLFTLGTDYFEAIPPALM
jgi:hypothetical protein